MTGAIITASPLPFANHNVNGCRTMFQRTVPFMAIWLRLAAVVRLGRFFVTPAGRAGAVLPVSQ